MSHILRQGIKIGEGIFLITQRGTHSSLPLNRSWPLVGGLRASPLTPVRRMATTGGTTGSRSIGSMGLFLLIVPIGTFCLGTWQVRRREWKLNLIEELSSKTNASPIPFPENLEELEDLEYRRVNMTGTFDHRREILMGPRPLMCYEEKHRGYGKNVTRIFKQVGGDVNQVGSGLISTGQSGFLVVTPFKLADRDLTVLVNRGWVPRKLRSPDSRLDGQVEGLVEMKAVVRKTEQRAPFMPENKQGTMVFLYRDVPTMSQMLRTEPVFLDAVDSVPGGPQGGQTRVNMRNEHLSYLMTWYSLSLATTYLWYRRFIMGKPLL
ncbi:Surfeit locus protein 1 [Chionoecetes opilio]|uniref:SURF1-like protein n=1 Tax=Chionoecetes opilio TaxID=41210 RepID=A0A8J4YGY8_CHIOP|nr:Surfeit locus protein 1 [Chionoecetes opilio]